MLTRPVNTRLRWSEVRVIGTPCVWALIFSLFALQPQANADAGRRPDYAGRWLPTVSLGIGAMFNPMSATAMSDGDSPESELVEISGSQLSVSPQFLILAGIESPEIARGVRIFASGGLIPTLSFEIDITKQGDPRGFSYPSQRDAGDPYPEAAIDGTGIRTTAQIDPIAWAANLGVSLSRKISDHQFDFRTSVGFFRHTVTADGARLRAIKPDTVDPFVREISLDDRYTQSYSSVGPAFEVGVDLGRKGRFKPTMFFDASFYRVIGDRTIELSDAGSDLYGTEVAQWTLRMDPWAYRLGLGMRVAWIGK